jgi:predicted transcriptional regulator
MIVFDNTLLLKKALAVLLQHGVQSAPVWDSKQQRFIGMLTVTDFIQLIVYYFDRSTSLEEALQEIDEMTIARLRGIL